MKTFKKHGTGFIKRSLALLLSVVMALSLGLTVFADTGSTLVSSQRGGAISTLVTGTLKGGITNIVERTTLYALGKGADAVENEALSKTFSAAKRLIGGAQGAALKNIQATCNQILAEVQALQLQLEESTNTLLQELQALNNKLDNQFLSESMNNLRVVYDTYQSLYDYYKTLAQTEAAYATYLEENPGVTSGSEYSTLKNAFESAYEKCVEINEDPTGETGLSLNFQTDANNLCSYISPYTASYGIANIQEDLTQNWGRRTPLCKHLWTMSTP